MIFNVSQLQESVDTYKKSNYEIMKLCEKICDTPFIKIKPNYAYKLSELEEELKTVGYAHKFFSFFYKLLIIAKLFSEIRFIR